MVMYVLIAGLTVLVLCVLSAIVEDIVRFASRGSSHSPRNIKAIRNREGDAVR